MMEQHRTSPWLSPRNWSFMARLTLVMILLVTITLAGVTFITIRTMQATLTDQIGENFKVQAVSLSDLIGTFLFGEASQLQVLALSDTIKEAVADRNAAYTGSPEEILAEIQALDAAWAAAADDDPFIASIIADDPKVNPVAFELADFERDFKEHAEVFVTDRYGATVAATGRLSDYYQADETWWQAAWNDGQGAVYISSPEFDESAGVYALLISVPLYSEETGEVIGILRTTLVVDELFELIEKQKFGQTGHAELFDGASEMLFDPGIKGPHEETTELAADLRQKFVSEVSGFEIGLGEHGSQMIFGHAIFSEESFEFGEMTASKRQIIDAVANLSWAAIVAQETEEAFASMDLIVRGGVIAGLAAIGLASLTALLLARTITRPLVTLCMAAEQIGAGNLDTPLPPIGGGDEIGRLAIGFEHMVAQLRNLMGSLEQRVADRTRGLQAATEVSRATTSVLDPDELLRRVVDLVRERFHLYYVGLFLLDEGGRFAVLRAGTGQAGQQMLAQGHRLEVGGESMIGQCVARSEVRIALDVGEEAVRFDNPLLPKTRSELALPLRSRGRVIGAMTVQSVEEAAFDEADIAVMQTMADQVAVAIDNAQLFAQTQAALKEVEATHRRYLERTWTEYLQTAKTTGYETGRPDSAPLGDMVLPEIRQAMERQSVMVLTGDGAEGERHSALVAPVALRGAVIGALGIHDEDGMRQWTDDEIALVEAVAERMALAAENLRLLDETQRRATRERLTREITDKMRRAADMEALIQTTVRDIAAALGASDAFVQLGTLPESAGDDNGK